jgi:hypothetical protein
MKIHCDIQKKEKRENIMYPLIIENIWHIENREKGNPIK